VLPASSCSRFLAPGHNLPDVHDHGRAGSELRFESIELDQRVQIKAAGADPVTWQRVFDPITIDALRTQHDVSWQQWGRWLVLVEPAELERGFDPIEMDSMAAAALFLRTRYRAAVAAAGAASDAA
jgi:hypothetical protein